MKKICFLLLPVAVLLASVISCSSAPQNSESASANAALDNIFARKSVRTYLNKGVEKEKIDLMLRAGMAAPSGKDLRPWEFYRQLFLCFRIKQTRRYTGILRSVFQMNDRSMINRSNLQSGMHL